MLQVSFEGKSLQIRLYKSISDFVVLVRVSLNKMKAKDFALFLHVTDYFTCSQNCLIRFER